MNKIIICTALILTACTGTTELERVKDVLPTFEKQLKDIDTDLSNPDYDVSWVFSDFREEVRDWVGYLRVRIRLLEDRPYFDFMEPKNDDVLKELERLFTGVIDNTSDKR